MGGRYTFANWNNRATVRGAAPCDPREAVSCSVPARSLNGYIGAVWDYEFSGNANGYVGTLQFLLRQYAAEQQSAKSA
ncbi:MAG: hypothetical protein LBU65_06770 [Planctomycetaceae bacterium]|nr:hypothetical protein [Planctomycetaceae bacterium]